MIEKTSRKTPVIEREFEKHRKDLYKWMSKKIHRFTDIMSKTCTGDLLNDDKVSSQIEQELKRYFLLMREDDKLNTQEEQQADATE